MGGEAHAFLRHASQKSHLLHAMLFRAVAAFCPWTVCTASMTTETSPSRKTPRRRAARGCLPRHPLESPSPRPGTLRAAARTLTGRQEPQATWRLQMPDASEAHEIAAEHGTTLHPTASDQARARPDRLRQLHRHQQTPWHLIQDQLRQQLARLPTHGQFHLRLRIRLLQLAR